MRERVPDLSGMFGIVIEVVADPVRGSRVESVFISPAGETPDDGMTRCIQAAAGKIELPNVAQPGREVFHLSYAVRES